MNIEQIESLVQLVTNSGVSEVTVKTETSRISVRRSVRPSVLQPTKPAVKPSELATIESTTSTQLVLSDSDSVLEESLEWITAPMVGVFYHAEPPIVAGSVVKSGTVVGVIESMKLMNDVRAEADGVVTESAIEAGMAVEFGQPLFALRGEDNG